MEHTITRRSLIAISLALLANPVFAAQRRYELDTRKANITYTFLLNDKPVKGVVPLESAKVLIDPNDLGNSTASVTADIRRARTGLIFATDALKSASVLNAKRFPLASFTSRKVRLGPNGRLSGGARIEGDLTLRGQTRPISLAADVFRAPGSAAQDLSNLTVKLAGQLSRAAFGATGYPKIVADNVRLDITVNVREVT
ncbi:MAG: YceI family protein [Paracoccaceae bacterium]